MTTTTMSSSRWGLHSSCSDCTVGRRAFSVAGPLVWNCLTPEVTSAPSLSTFRTRLETYLFSESCPDIRLIWHFCVYTLYSGPASVLITQVTLKIHNWLMKTSANFIWTCRFNLLHSAITFHHFFNLSLWAQNLPFQKILSSTLVCFCLSDWSHGSRPFTGFICSSVLCFSSIFFLF